MIAATLIRWPGANPGQPAATATMTTYLVSFEGDDRPGARCDSLDAALELVEAERFGVAWAIGELQPDGSVRQVAHGNVDHTEPQ